MKPELIGAFREYIVAHVSQRRVAGSRGDAV
jgi:hypothetical protein